MSIPFFVGPLVSVLLLLLAVIGVWFYYCYFKSKKQNRESSATTIAGTKRVHLVHKLDRYDAEEYYYGLPSVSTGSFGYLAYGGFPISIAETNGLYWAAGKNQAQTRSICKTEYIRIPRVATGKSKEQETTPRPAFIRELSFDNRARATNHLQVIEECEEEKGELEEQSEINDEEEGEMLDGIKEQKERGSVTT